MGYRRRYENPRSVPRTKKRGRRQLTDGNYAISPPWLTLPVELRLDIFDIVAREDPSRLAVYASVNREWQHYFERITFKHLTLDLYRAMELRWMAADRRRQEAIKRIYLCIRLG